MLNVHKHTILSLVFIATILVGCSEDEKIKSNKRLITVNAQMEANELAEAGEQLVGPFTYMLADRVFDLALEKDPTNLKAQFYKSFIKPQMLFKGYINRIRPLVKKFSPKDGLAQFDKNLNHIPYSPFREFIMNGGTVMKTEKDVTNFLADYRDAWNDFRVFLKKNSANDMTINLNPHVWKDTIKSRSYNQCKVVDTDIVVSEDDSPYFDVECDFRHIAQVKLNQADFKALEQMAAGWVLMFTMYTSYELTGAFKAITISQQRPGSLSNQETQNILESVPEFGKLSARESFSQISGLGAEAVSAAKWVSKFQRKLCPQGYPTKENRPNYLMETGFCIDYNRKPGDPSFDENWAKVEAALQGPMYFFVDDKDGNEVRKKIDYMAMSRNPVKDLRTIAPKKYNECDRVAEIRDATLGGTFPDGDYHDLVDGERCPLVWHQWKPKQTEPASAYDFDGAAAQVETSTTTSQVAEQ